jgi:twitching motility two-component system response regulator PilG
MISTNHSVSVGAIEKSQKHSAIEVFQSLATLQDGSAHIVRDRIQWTFYVERGKLVYATHSLDGLERLERHLRRMSRELPSLTDKLRSQLRLMFDDASSEHIKPSNPNNEFICVEYLAVIWLVNENHLPKPMANKLIARIMQEVIEIFLCLPDGEFKIVHNKHSLQEAYCGLSIDRILEVVPQRLKAWYDLGPTISSPYQCPYLVSQTSAEKRMTPETVQRLRRVLRGFNFCQLGALFGKDPLAIAKQLSPLISDGAILLRDPTSPLDMLPRTYYLAPEEELENIEKLSETFAEINNTGADISDLSQIVRQQATKTWKIVCIDDSESMLSMISSYLGNEDFELTLIQDSMKALMRITSIRPELILLDIGMPNVDGYQLCSLIRKSSLLREIPIVMVTGNKGLIDRARARIAGATDYLTKPFDRAELLKMIMRHLM